MIMKKNIFILALLAFGLASCEIEPVQVEDVFSDAYAFEKEKRHLTINEFLDEFMTEEGNFMNWKERGLDCPYRTRTTNGDGIYLFSIDTLPIDGPGLYIKGRVITEDHAGNFYKSMVIQQIIDGEQQTLRISVDASSVSGQYNIGQMIAIRVNGFSIGRYANQPQLCVPTYNNNIYANNAEQKMGWAPGRIPFSRFQKATQRIGMPDKSKIVVDTISISDFQSLPLDGVDNQKAIRYMDGRLVCLKGVYFTGQYSDTDGSLVDCTTGNPEDDTNANVFAPTTTNIGYPQSRVVSNGTDYTVVSTSEYAKFARFYLPGCNAYGNDNAKSYVGEVTGILGYYRDNPRYESDKWDWSITLRSLSEKGWGTEQDLQLKHVETGEPWVPQEYGEK